MATEAHQGPKGLRTKSVRERLDGISTATLYRWMAKNGFPKPRKVGNSSTNLWDAAEVDAWIAAQLSGVSK